VSRKIELTSRQKTIISAC